VPNEVIVWTGSNSGLHKRNVMNIFQVVGEKDLLKRCGFDWINKHIFVWLDASL